MAKSISGNRIIMLSALKEKVIPSIKNVGFSGSFPHYRRFNDKSIDLITFQTNKYGGSFLIEVSAGFPFAEEKNYKLYGKMTEKTLNTYATNNRYRLPGMFGGPWFYYCDVYLKKRLLQKADYYDDFENTGSAPEGYSIVQSFDENTANDICVEINKQLKKAFEWIEKFKKTNL